MNHTAEQIADLFFVDASTVRRWATKSRHHAPCPHTKDGRGRLRFDPDLVDEWLTKTGVAKNSRAQTRHTPPTPPVGITTALRWEAHHIADDDLDDEDRRVVALHRTIATGMHVCRNSPELPDPPDLDLHADADQREAALLFLLRQDHRPAEEWRRIAREAIADEAELMDALHG